MSERMSTAAEMSDGWIRPHDMYADGISTTDHVRAVLESEEETADDWREPEEAAAFRAVLARAVVSGVGRTFADGGPAVVTFPDGSRITFHAWADGVASGWWWMGYGDADMPERVRDGIAEEAADLMDVAERDLWRAVADAVAGFREPHAVAEAVGAASTRYVAARTDAERYGVDALAAEPRAALDVIADAVAEGMRARDAAAAA